MAGNHVLLETIQLTQTATSITFDNLPTSGYTDLKIVCSVRGTGSSNYIGANILFNGTSASTNWSRNQIEGGDAAVNAYTSTSSSIGYFPDGNFTANAFGTSILYISNYRSSNYKTVSVESAGEAASTTAVYMDMFTQTWSNTSAITSIQIGNASSSLAVGCTFSLYGVAATGTTPVTAPLATGGNIVANDGTYWYHAFLSSGNFVPQTALTCDYLVVAGGGGAGFGAYSGGGGAGGYRTASTQSFTATNYAVAVGAGGAGGTSGRGTNGVDSSIIGVAISTTSTGGGAGGSYTGGSFTNGLAGGSGGGGSSNTGTGGAGNTPSTSPVQGYAGGAGNGNGGGGGGGSSSVGAGLPSTTTMQAAGGSGTANSISGTSVTYAAGGKGSGNGGQAAVNGTTSTGNGGNASGITSPAFLAGGSGGSGIVIIRYAMV